MSFFADLLSRHLPNNVKRMICLATFSSKLVQENGLPLNSTFFNKLNNTLDLAENEGSMKFAVCFTEYLWGKTKLDKLTHSDVTEYLYQAIPPCLRWDSKENIKQDLSLALTKFASA